MGCACSRSLPPKRPSTTPIWIGTLSTPASPRRFRPSLARARGSLSSAPTRCRGGAELFRRNLLGLGGDDFFHRAAPAVVCQIEDDAVRVLVLDLVEGVRIALGSAGKMHAAGVGHLLRGLLEVVDPHAEM